MLSGACVVTSRIPSADCDVFLRVWEVILRQLVCIVSSGATFFFWAKVCTESTEPSSVSPTHIQYLYVWMSETHWLLLATPLDFKTHVDKFLIACPFQAISEVETWNDLGERDVFSKKGKGKWEKKKRRIFRGVSPSIKKLNWKHPFLSLMNPLER